MSTSKRISYAEITFLFNKSINDAVEKLFSEANIHGWTREEYENLSNEVDSFEEIEICNEDTIH